MFTEPDALYCLLPAYILQQDQKSGKALQQLLDIVGEQAAALEKDLERMYDGWFIETCDEWLIPYIGDLLGLAPSNLSLGISGVERSLRLRRVLSARAATANAIAQHRRKGTLWILEEIARDVAHWPARAVEYQRRLVTTAHLDHLHLNRQATADLHSARLLAELDGAFDDFCHTGNVRRISNAESRGMSSIANVGLFVWRTRPYEVVATPAYRHEEVGKHCFTFSALGNDAPLFRHAVPELERSGIAGAQNLPVPIYRWALEAGAPGDAGRAQADPALYGKDASLYIEAMDWPSPANTLHITPERVIPADLTDWAYKVPKDHVAVDPVLGRIAFAKSQAPRQLVKVWYRYGFAMDIGGGRYARKPLPLPPAVEHLQVWASKSTDPNHVRITSIAQAFKQWREQREQNQAAAAAPPTAQPSLVIELMENAVYHGRFTLELWPGETVAIVAGTGVRPVIWLPDETTDAADVISLRGGRGSRIILDGLLIAGRALEVSNIDPADNQAQVVGELCELWIRHSTLVPGGSLHPDCEPCAPSRPSIVVDNTRACVRIESSIVGAIQILNDTDLREPTPINLCDSIVDATGNQRVAIGGAAGEIGYAQLKVLRCTLVGTVCVHALQYAQDSIFSSRVTVVRRQTGCLRFCYVPPQSRTPRRFACQPGDTLQASDGRQPVTPHFESQRYGTPTYLRLTECTSPLIRCGAHDESEMGVYHDLFEPQRLAMLSDRLAEFVPASCDAAVIFAS
jgi:hypothetical protein